MSRSQNEKAKTKPAKYSKQYRQIDEMCPFCGITGTVKKPSKEIIFPCHISIFSLSSKSQSSNRLHAPHALTASFFRACGHFLA